MVGGVFAVRVLSRCLVQHVIKRLLSGLSLGIVKYGEEGVVGKNVLSEDEVSHRNRLTALKALAVVLVLVLGFFPCDFGDVVIDNLNLVFGVHKAFEAHDVVDLGDGNALEQVACGSVARRKIEVDEIFKAQEVYNFVGAEVVLASGQKLTFIIRSSIASLNRSKIRMSSCL